MSDSIGVSEMQLALAERAPVEHRPVHPGDELCHAALLPKLAHVRGCALARLVVAYVQMDDAVHVLGTKLVLPPVVGRAWRSGSVPQAPGIGAIAEGGGELPHESRLRVECYQALIRDPNVEERIGRLARYVAHRDIGRKPTHEGAALCPSAEAEEQMPHDWAPVHRDHEPLNVAQVDPHGEILSDRLARYFYEQAVSSAKSASVRLSSGYSSRTVLSPAAEYR